MNQTQTRINPHNLGYCCRYARNETCVGCGDSENGLPVKVRKARIEPVPKEMGTTLSTLELSIVRKMQGSVTFVPGSSHKRFIKGLSEKSLVTTRGRIYLAYVAHRYRKQWIRQATDEEFEWIVRMKAY